MAESSRRVRSAVSAAVIATLAGLAGCGGGEEVRSYQVPRSTEPSGKAPPAQTGDFRILGAAYPADNPVWYFKFTGTADEVARHEADFDKLAASVKLRGDAIPAFTLPPDWTLGGPREVERDGVLVRFEQTIRVGDSEVTVSRAGGGLPRNVSRWAKQVGNTAAIRDPSRVTREFQADGVKGVRIDVKGPVNPSPGGQAPSGSGR